MKYFILTLLLAAAIVQADDRANNIKRLEKGEYYYHYLNGDFPTAMNQLEQWRHSDEALADEARIMEAAMLLSLGLHENARQVFEKIQKKGSAQASGRSWFYLSRRYFELAEFDRVVETLDQASTAGLDDRFVAEALFMKVSALLELGLLKQAQLVLETMPRDDIWTGYARHNFILAMMDGNTSGRGFELLVEDATFYLPNTQEAKDLKDRINLITAMFYLDGGKNRAAEKHLKRISLAGPYTHAALLQYGWSQVEQWQYEEALQPWRELQVRFNKFDPEVMESMVGVPHVLELMNAQTQALKTYEITEERFLALDSRLQEIQQTLPEGRWIEAWAEQQTGLDWGWDAEVDDQIAIGDTAGALKNLLSKDSYISLLNEFRDIWVLQRYLSEKESALILWKDLVRQRKTSASKSDAKQQLAKFSYSLNQAKQRQAYLYGQLERSRSEKFAFPAGAQGQQVNRIGYSSKNIEALMGSDSKTRKLTDYQERWRRVQGILAWQMNETKPQREWQLTKELVQLKSLISDAERQLVEAKVALVWSPSSWQGLDKRIETLLAQVSLLRKQADQNLEISRQSLVSVAAQYVDGERLRIRDYLGQTRLSIARLYDDALQRQVAAAGLGEGDE